MADLKISQLTAATTPLAGTEILPIVQSSTTKKVSVDNLTEGKAVTALSIEVTDLKATNLKAKDGTASASIANSTGVFTHSTATVFTAGTVSAPAITTSGDTNTGIYFPAADAVAIATNGVQKVYVAATGEITAGIENDTTAQNSGRLNLYGAASSGYGSAIFGYNNSTAGWFVGSYSQIAGGTQYTSVGIRAGTTGGQYMTSGGTTWNAVSDETRKDIIEPITDAANKVSTLRAVIGKYKTDEDGVRRSFLIAQDVQAVLPEAVNSTEDREGVVLGLAYTDVIPLLVAAIKELKAELEDIKNQR